MLWSDPLTLVLIFVYGSALGVTTIYALFQAHLLYLYRASKRSTSFQSSAISASRTQLPKVTVQLPIYNELYVVERLLDAVAKLDYPAHLLEIQVLDDSTDQTSELIERKLEELASSGLKFVHIRRADRVGFKAGALKYGMETADGEFLAIFDADFLPEPDFLKKLIPAFDDPDIALVQTRWSHLNEHYSLLTRLLAFALNVHFSVEQRGRNFGSFFMNFNGTAGMWRKAAIEDSGGWEPDTLTEDLDLSYRAQLRGWRMKFYEDVATPAELPVMMSGIKTQQFRWTKGAAECARKNLDKVFSSNLPLSTKLHATAHLMSCIICVCLLVAAISSVLIAYRLQAGAELIPFLELSAVFFVGLLAILSVYWTAWCARKPLRTPRDLFAFVLTFFAFTAMYLGLSIHNCRATFEGLTGKKSAFIRTPKFNIVGKTGNWLEKNNYAASEVSSVMLLEAGAVVLFAAGATISFQGKLIWMGCFHLLAAAGFAAVTFYNFLHMRPKTLGTQKPN